MGRGSLPVRPTAAGAGKFEQGSDCECGCGCDCNCICNCDAGPAQLYCLREARPSQQMKSKKWGGGCVWMRASNRWTDTDRRAAAERPGGRSSTAGARGLDRAGRMPVAGEECGRGELSGESDSERAERRRRRVSVCGDDEWRRSPAALAIAAAGPVSGRVAAPNSADGERRREAEHGGWGGEAVRAARSRRPKGERAAAGGRSERTATSAAGSDERRRDQKGRARVGLSGEKEWAARVGGGSGVSE